MNRIEIIPYDYTQPQHLKGIATLINAYIEDRMGGGTPLSESRQLRLADLLNRHPTTIVLLACCESEVCGLLIAFENISTFTVRPMINIHDIVVLPEYRRKGIGKLLLEAAINTGKEKGCSRITLEVRQDNLPAQQLYKSMDFKETQPPMYYWRKELE
ncbi:MAG: GNAT family N-acetyltransferase [Dysgonamonadaceae bacterium]|jgi:GNAT superfamily N-acetyltransferase|nr:GNAT family N-acetyltransferase [Dysgonamonadaceae bacterium]